MHCHRNTARCFISGVARGALSNVLTQGASIAAGLQKKFDWVGVAVGGAAGGVSGALQGRFEGINTRDGARFISRSIEDYAQQTLTGAAAAIAGGAARSLITGTDFGDNVLAALPDVIGSTIGGMIARGVAATPRKAAAIPGNAGGRGGSPQNPVSSSASEAGNTQQYLANLAQELGPLLAHSMPIEQTDFKAISARSERKQPIIERLYKEYLASNKAAQVKEDRDFVNASGIIVTASKSKQAAARAERTEYFPTTPRMTLSRAINDVWRQEFVGDYGPLVTTASRSEYNLKLASYDAWDRQLQEWDGIANAQIDRDIGGFVLTSMGSGFVAVAAPAIGGYLFAEGSGYYYATTAIAGGGLNVGLGEGLDKVYGNTATNGDRVNRFIGGASIVIGSLPALQAISPVARGGISGGFGGLAGSAAQQRIDTGNISLSKTLFEGARSAAIGSVVGKVLGRVGQDSLSIRGINTGRNNWIGTYNGGVTRISNGQAWTISPGVAIRGGVANVVREAPGIVHGAVAEQYVPTIEPKKARSR